MATFMKYLLLPVLSVGLSCSAYAATESYQLHGFDQLQLAGHYQVNFTQAKQYAVSVTSSNLGDVQVLVSGNKLIAKQKSHFSMDEPFFQIKISAPQLTNASLSGNYEGHFILPDGKSFSLSTQGQGNVTLAGKLKQFSLDSKGSHILNARKACAGAIAVQSAGTLNATFCVDKNASFDRVIAGQADITIYGQPVFGKTLGFGAVSVQVKNQ